MNIQFQTPWLLYLIWIIPVLSALWVMLQRKSRRAMDTFVPPVLQQKLFPRRNPNRQYWQIAFVSLGALLLLMASAGPRWGNRDETVLQQSRDLIIAIDVSLSMMANDVHPSRLQRAKIDCIDLISSLKGDRAALIAFRSKPALVCPLTTDYAFLRQALAGIDPNSAPRGETDIGIAISRALDAFNETEASHKAIILISDGEDLSGQALEMAENAGKRGIPIYTVGIGSRSGSTIPDPQNPGQVLQYEGKPVLTKLDHESLYTIAQKSGGSYIPVETASTTSTTLGNLYEDHLRNVTRRELTETRQRRAVERYQWFLFPAFFFLAGACMFSRGRLAVGPRKKHSTFAPKKPTLVRTPAPVTLKSIAILIATFSLMHNGYAQNATNALPLQKPTATASGPEAAAASQPSTSAPETAPELSIPKLSGRDAARAAQNLFKNGSYAEAAALYQKAALDSDRDSERAWRYNAAVALEAEGKHTEAADLFRTLSLHGRQGDVDANPALGVTLFNAAQEAATDTAEGSAVKADNLRQSGEAFKAAWRDAPDSDARHDLALTLKKLPGAEENAKALRLAEKYKETPAPTLADQMLKTQREISTGITKAATNAIPDRIRAFETLARQQQENADIWLPLKTKLAEALAQQKDDDQTKKNAAALYQLMQVTQDNMNEGYHSLRDIKSEAFRPAKTAEQGTYQLWKAVAPHEMLLNETIHQQTNAMEQVAGRQSADPTQTTSELQLESASLTDLFKKRFEQAIPPEGTVKKPEQTTPSTVSNEKDTSDKEPEGITPEARAKVIELADKTITLQREAADQITKGETEEASENQQTARDHLTQIRELLPKQPPQEQQQEQKQEQKQDEPKPQDQQQEQKQEEQKPEPKPQEDNEKKESNDDTQKLLQRALEREREFQDEKRKRQDMIPLPPSSRDW